MTLLLVSYFKSMHFIEKRMVTLVSEKFLGNR